MQHNIPIIIISLGIFLILFGILWLALSKFTPLDKLPGDITYKSKNTTIYFPLATLTIISILLSIILTIIVRFLSK